MTKFWPVGCSASVTSVSRKFSQMTAHGCPLPFLDWCLEIRCGAGVPWTMKLDHEVRVAPWDERAETAESAWIVVLCGDTVAARAASPYLDSDAWDTPASVCGCVLDRQGWTKATFGYYLTVLEARSLNSASLGHVRESAWLPCLQRL